MKQSIELQDRTIIVSGASSGIGAHFAETLANRGAKVALAARRMDKLETHVERIQSAGGKAIAVQMDVAEEDSVIAAYDQVQDKLGEIDTVIANAGRNADGRATDLPVEDFDALMSVNLRGVFLSAREGARRMMKTYSREEKRGRIVIVSSITAKMVTPGISAYSASKAAINHMGRVFAREWASSGINVNMLLPGYIETDLTSGAFQTDAGKMFLNSFPRRSLVGIDEMDEMLAFLCSDASAAVTGGEFVVDDGQSL